MGTASGSYSQTIDVGMVITYTVPNLADGTTYYFVVRAYNANRQYGPLSSEVSGVTSAPAPPTPPSNLTAAVRNGTLVDLAWQAPAGTVTGYRIEVGSGAGQSNVATLNVGTATTYTISTLPAGTYYIRVRSTNAAGVSAPSNEVTATLVAAPPPPTNLVATVRSGQYVDLSWTAPTGTVTGYRIEVGTSSGQTNVTTLNVGTATTYTISTLPAGTYYIRVRAVNSVGTSSPSNQVTATVGTAPAAPTNLTATVRSGQYIDLSWTAPSGTVTGYRIEVGTSSGQSNVTTINTGTGTTYTISTLTAGTYYIRVRAVNSVGTSAPSNQVTATLTTTAPPPPSNLTAPVLDGQVAALAWNPPSTTVDGYRVEVGTASGQSNVRTTNVTVTSLTISDLRGGPYYMRVRSVRASQVSAPSNEVQVLYVPAPPTGLTATVRRRKHVDLAWQAASGASSYTVEVGSAPGRADVRSAVSTTTRFTVSDLPVGVYYIRVRGMNTAGLGAASNEVQVQITRGGKPSTPTNLTATLRDSSLIDLAWEADDEDATYYRVEVGTTPGTTDVSSFTTGVTTSFTIGELPARTYYVRVRSANDSGLSDPTNDVVVTTSAGGNNAPRRLSGTVNPAGVVRLMWDEPLDPAGITAYVVEAGAGPGRSDLGSIRINTRGFAAGPLPNGTYFVRVRAVTAAGVGPVSNEVVLHIGNQQACTAPPAAPRLAANVVGTFLEMSWAPGVGDAPTGYVLDVGTTPGRRDVASVPLGADVTSVTTQVPNGTYALRLIAVNACGASTWGADTSVTVGGPEVTLPGAPSNLVQQVTGRSVTLTWAPPTTGGDATSYVIEVLSPANQVILRLDTGNLSTAFTHGNVPAGQYTVRVRAINARGLGEPSNSVVVSVP